MPPEYGSPSKPVKVSYVVVRHKGKLIAKFDGDIYFPLGNSAEGGLFPLLGKGSKQLIVSQDIFRTGVQWVADFSKGFKIIFDGEKFNVGREGSDMAISDLDSDGVYEITVPMTAVGTGERAEGGLRKVYAENSELVIELYGKGVRVNENLYGTNASVCCPSSFTRTRYRWAEKYFVRRGES